MVAKLIEIIERLRTAMPEGGQAAACSELDARKPPLET